MNPFNNNYPNLDIPFHSRWSHFQAGNIDRLKELDRKLTNLSLYDKARAKLDLVLVSVLLDAGAGDTWCYLDKKSGQTFKRSEGLAIASFDMYMAGVFSSDKLNPLQVDAKSLMFFNREKLELGFQVSQHNPLEGLEGRVSLICELGKALVNKDDIFKDHRPGNILDFLIRALITENFFLVPVGKSLNLTFKNFVNCSFSKKSISQQLFINNDD